MGGRSRHSPGVNVSAQQDEDPPRWEKAASERRRDGGLGLPAGFTAPRWLPVVAFAFLLANSVKQAAQADSTFDLVWAAVGMVLWGSLLVVVLRRSHRER